MKRQLLSVLLGAMLAWLMAPGASPATAADVPSASATFAPGPRPGDWRGPVYPPGIAAATDASGGFCLARGGRCLPATSSPAGAAGDGPAAPPLTVGVWASPTSPSRYQDVSFGWSVFPSPGTVCSDYFGNHWSNSGGASFLRGVWDQPDRFDYWVYCAGPGGEAAASVTITIQSPPQPPPPPPPPPADTTPPVLGAFGVSGTPTGDSVTVWWDAATDGGGVAGYSLYRDGAAVATLSAAARNFVLDGLACGTGYTIGLEAFDAAGNRSARKTVAATTAPCSQPPADEIVPGDFSWGWSEEVVRPQTHVRCKRQEFTQSYSLLWGHVDALRYEGSFRVCYLPGQRIDSVTYVRGDATWVRFGLTWLGNDAGYPNYAKNTASVVLQWRGSIAPCFTTTLCAARRHPWVTLTFYPDNTITREVGVA